MSGFYNTLHYQCIWVGPCVRWAFTVQYVGTVHICIYIPYACCLQYVCTDSAMFQYTDVLVTVMSLWWICDFHIGSVHTYLVQFQNLCNLLASNCVNRVERLKTVLGYCLCHINLGTVSILLLTTLHTSTSPPHPPHVCTPGWPKGSRGTAEAGGK